MRLSDGIKLKGRWNEIPDCSRDDLPEFFKELDFKAGVEVGTYLGEYAEIIAKSGLKLFCVDPWLSYTDYPYYSKWEQKQETLDKQYEETKKRLDPYKNVTIIRKTSMEAADLFEDNSIDFVYIDGNHSFRYIAEDLCEWIKKVRPGGVVCGHDYYYGNPKTFHVRYVVDAFVESHAIPQLFILGRKAHQKGERRDDWRSWMFFKPK